MWLVDSDVFQSITSQQLSLTKLGRIHEADAIRCPLVSIYVVPINLSPVFRFRILTSFHPMPRVLGVSAFRRSRPRPGPPAWPGLSPGRALSPPFRPSFASWMSTAVGRPIEAFAFGFRACDSRGDGHAKCRKMVSVLGEAMPMRDDGRPIQVGFDGKEVERPCSEDQTRGCPLACLLQGG